ncbi:hypothetical protein [Gimesia panareensis]|uniref:Uncharacterized protein n=1 Tax=Gimesia panareensis TaxID=2527978 RepID=A0A517Q6D3_9PLAN|nr:hypothetical protein [Gimesia panareensis]QDT27174.1 hypothetical protein Enr10x_24890 [Gimesia panareensis]QDU49976.1 hypothetical protein Pan110_23170 [Gimesia panareensis]
MTGYHEEDPRTQFQTCPGCQADIDRDSTSCEFCQCEFDFEHPGDEQNTRLASTEEEVTTDPDTKCLVFLTLNVATTIVSLLASSLAEPPPRRYSNPSPPRATVEQRENMIRFLQEQSRARVEDLSERLKYGMTAQQTEHKPVRF